jgi:hypothetical protein
MRGNVMDETTEASSVPPAPPLPPTPPKASHKRVIVGAAIGAVVIAGIASGTTVLLLSGADKESPHPEPKATVSAAPAVTEEAEETYNEAPTATDFALTLKTTHKQCFGSAGCNVTVEPNLMYASMIPLDPDSTISITYEVHGDESGLVVETMELTSQDQLSYKPVSISTASSSTKVYAKVTDVQISG